MDGIAILVWLMVLGGVGGLLLGLYLQSGSRKTQTVYRGDGTSYKAYMDGTMVGARKPKPPVLVSGPSYPTYQQPVYRPGWGSVAGAGAVGFVAGAAWERHHHHKQEAHAQFQADINRIQYNNYHPHHQPQVVQSVDRPWWDHQDIYFDPYNSDGGHHFGHHSW